MKTHPVDEEQRRKREAILKHAGDNMVTVREALEHFAAYGYVKFKDGRIVHIDGQSLLNQRVEPMTIIIGD